MMGAGRNFRILVQPIIHSNGPLGKFEIGSYVLNTNHAYTISYRCRTERKQGPSQVRYLIILEPTLSAM